MISLKNKIRITLAFFSFCLVFSVASFDSVSAIELFKPCSGASGAAVCEAENTDDAGTIVTNIISILLYFIGAVAAIMIVIGGIKYATANGKKENIESAKNTVMYSVIGLVAAMAGQALVFFIVDGFQ